MGQKKAIFSIIFIALLFLGGVACSSIEDIPSPAPSAAPAPEIKNDGENRYPFPGPQALVAMGQSADYVVEGVVGPMWSRWEVDERGNTLIFTYATVNLTHVFKGALPPTITVKNVGGQVGDEVMFYSHVPQFWSEGEHVFLFLNSRIGYLWGRQGEPSKIVINTDDNAEFVDELVSVKDLRALIVESQPK